MYFAKINTAKTISFKLVVITLAIVSKTAWAQPYLDIVNLKYTNSPNAGVLNQNKKDVQIQYFGLGTNIPFQFKNKKDAVIVSPFFENWLTKTDTLNRQSYYSLALPVSLSKTIPYTKWAVLITAIIRMNDSTISKDGAWQAGGAIITSYKRNEKLTWKFGLYVNNEFFDVLVIPLLGIGWRINSRNNLFGVLPGSLTYEHRVNKHFYYGANFRATTNSYAKNIGYWRIDENQLGIYLDSYLTENIVVNIEAGHSLFRKIRTGVKHISKYDADVRDNLYARISLAYRVRFKN